MTYNLSTNDGKWDSTIVYDVRVPKLLIWVYLIFNTILCLLIIAINSILIHAIRKLGKQKKVSFQFILCMNVSDILIGIIQLLLQLSILLPQPESLDAKTMCAQFAIYFVSQMSGGSTILLGIDRFVHMKYLTRYNELMTKRRANMMIAASIVINFITSTLLTVSSAHKFFFYYNIILFPSYVIAMVCLFIIYLRAYLSVKQRVKSIGLHTMRKPTGNRASNPEHKFVKMMLLILTCLFICYLPSVILGMVQTILLRHGPLSDYMKYAVICSYTIAYVNSMVNAILIIIANNQVKCYIIGMFNKSSNRQDREQSNVTSTRRQTGGAVVFNAAGNT